MEGDLNNRPKISKMTDIAKELLNKKAKVRRSDAVRAYMGGNAEFQRDKEKYPTGGQRAKLREIATNVFAQLEQEGFCSSRIDKVSKPETKTGSGEVKYYTLVGRRPK